MLEHKSSRPELFCEKNIPINFVKFTGKQLCQSPSFNKVLGLRPATLLKKWLWHRCFPVNFAKFLRRPFLTKHFWWLPLRAECMILTYSIQFISISVFFLWHRNSDLQKIYIPKCTMFHWPKSLYNIFYFAEKLILQLLIWLCYILILSNFSLLYEISYDNQLWCGKLHQ